MPGPTLHSSRFLGEVGDYFIEIAAGLGVLLTVSGLYLRWPRGGRLSDALLPRLSLARRPGWRDLHASAGFWISGALLVFLISGLTWTSIWSSRITQAWNSLPEARIAAPLSADQHASMNRGVLDEVPWVLEQRPMPVSGSALTALVMWWKRRPATGLRLGPPPLPRDLNAWKGAVALMFVLSLAFPLAAVAIGVVLVLDRLVIARIPALKLMLE